MASAPLSTPLCRDGEDRLTPGEIEALPVIGCGSVQGVSTLQDVPDPVDGFPAGKNPGPRVVHGFEPRDGLALGSHHSGVPHSFNTLLETLSFSPTK